MTGSVLRALLLGGAAAFVTVVSAAAEDQVIDLQTTSDADKVAKGYKVDTAVPSSPAFAIIGATPAKAVTGGFTPDLVWEAIESEDDIPGFGIAAKPYWLIGPGRDKTLRQYQGPALMRDGKEDLDRGPNDYSLEAFLGRTSISTAVGARDGKKEAALALGLGIHTSIFPTADPRLDRRLTRCLDNALWETQPAAQDAIVLRPGAPPLPPRPAPPLEGKTFERFKGDAARLLMMRIQQSRPPGASLGALSVSLGELEAAKDEKALEKKFIELYSQTGPGDSEAAKRELAAMRKALVASLPAAQPDQDSETERRTIVASDGRVIGVEQRKLVTVGDYAKDSAACYSAAQVRLANVQELSFGLGAVALSPERRGDDLDYAGTSVWVTWRYPLGSYLKGCNPDKGEPELEVAEGDTAARDKHCLKPMGNLSVFSRYTWDEEVPINDTTTANAALGIMGVAFQKTAQNDRWSFELAASYNWRNFTTAGYDDEEYWRLSAEGSLRLTDFARLNVGYGTVTDSPIGEDDFTIVRLVLATSAGREEKKEK